MVLVIGGGDGGVLRELAKHPKVEEIYHCEIDREVIEACKTFMPSMGCGYNSCKLKSFTGDGAEFLNTTEETFDVIITDASDPVVGSEDESQTKNGPAESLFNDDYYMNMKARLNEGGILCCQGENMWLHATLIARILKICREAYPVVEYAYTCTPSYPSGQIGFILCSKNHNTNFREPCFKWKDSEIDKYSLKYYNEDIHRAAFVLPSFMRNILK